MATVTGHSGLGKGEEKRFKAMKKKRSVLMQEHVAACEECARNFEMEIDDLVKKVTWKKLIEVNKELNAVNAEYMNLAINCMTEDELKEEYAMMSQYKEAYFRCEVLYEDMKERGTMEVKKNLYDKPKMELKTFDGTPGTWLPFWNQFRRIHEDQLVSKGDKLQYLHQCTEGRAKDLVSAYPQLEENYDKVLQHLQNRFANRKTLVRYYVNEILKLVLDAKIKNNIELLYRTLETKIRALETLEVTKDSYGDLLLPLVEAALPEEVLLLWHRQGGQNSGGELESILEFLGKEVESRGQVEEIGLTFTSNRKSMKGADKPVEKGRSAAALIQVGVNVACIFCGRVNHKSTECFQANRLTLDERKKIVVKAGACFCCLKVGHRVSKCTSGIECTSCQGKHHKLMCNQRGKEASNLACLGSKVKNNNGYLPTLLVQVGRGRQTRVVRALVDSGCQNSYILESLARELKLQIVGQEEITNCLFGGVMSQKRMYQLYEVRVSDLKGIWSVSMNVFGERVLCKNVPSVGMDVVNKFPEVTFSDAEQVSEISLVLGADVFGKIFSGVKTICREGLTALETKLGWVLTGPRKGDPHVNMMAICLKNSVLPTLWDLDTLGITDHPGKEDDEDALIHFRENVSRDEQGRYSVALPWLLEHEVLPDYYEMAEKRLKRMTERLCHNKLVESYQLVLEEWLSLGIIEEVPKEELVRPCHYLAHRPVVKMAKETTKIRPVFDASGHKQGFPSLNDCLSKGPNILELITPLLIKFRLHKYGLIADIEKAFLQVGVVKGDRDFLRFLWWKKGKINKELVIYRHRRLVFGVCCSPFLLGATIAHHLEKYGEEHMEMRAVVDKLACSLYVDDCVVSVESKDELHKFVLESEKVMRDACFNLRGWKYNGKEPVEQSDNTETSVLGLTWDLHEDTLKCSFNSADIGEGKIFTKRGLLSLANRIFDPLGMLSPVTVTLKLFLQRAWQLGVSWDEELPAEITDKLRPWLKHLTLLNECKVPRWVCGEVVDWERCSLHVFCDASNSAYATCIFLRLKGANQVRLQLLLAKARVAPLKEITIPRLELMGALIGARLYDSVRKALPVQVTTTFWTDSRVVLSWIKRKEQWNVFVRNRIEEIRKITGSENWKHIPGKLNPADLPSRGCHVSSLLEQTWWNGPKWLTLPPEEWPQEEGVADENEVLKERKKGVCMIAVRDSFFVDSFTRYFSRYNRIVRMCAWMCRFITKLRSSYEMKRGKGLRAKAKSTPRLDQNKGELTSQEIIKAEMLLLKLVQKECLSECDVRMFAGLKLFKDEQGLIRVESRLTQGLDEKDFRNPIVLREHELVKRLVIETHVNLGHAGTLVTLSQLRERFFIIRGRQLVKKIVKSCVTCRKVLAKPIVVPEAPLPVERTARVGAFQVSGVDLGGPIFVRGGKKVWFALFTCAVYRGVHLELVENLTTESFIMALRRFIARRGRVSILYSDQGTNFVGAKNLLGRLDGNALHQECANKRIEWRLNPPGAPWWGGWWERLIGMVKIALKKVLGKAYLSYTELETVLCDIESVVNSRPLTYLSEDPRDLSAISPAHFIQDIPNSGTTDLDKIDGDYLRKRVKYIHSIRDHLRVRFKREYLGELINRHSGKKKRTSEIKVGDVVLVEDQQRKRIDWPLARVVELIPGRDGKFRVAKLRLESGELMRPVQRLCPLEVDSVSAINLKENVLRTRSGRAVKPVARLDL